MAVKLSSLHQRLHAVLQGMGARELSRLTRTNHETVRRYINGDTPSAEFLSAICRVRGVDARWLLTGEGPREYRPVLKHADVDLGPLIVAAEGLLQWSQRLVGALDAGRLDSDGAAADAGAVQPN